jgi:hypothetical protein
VLSTGFTATAEREMAVSAEQLFATLEDGPADVQGASG